MRIGQGAVSIFLVGGSGGVVCIFNHRVTVTLAIIRIKSPPGKFALVGIEIAR